MSIFYRIIIVLLILTGAYSVFGIVHFKRMYHKVENPRAEFQVLKNQDAPLTLVEFTGYYCGYCKQLQPVIDELLAIRKDIRFVTRPVVFTLYDNIDGEMVPHDDDLTKQIFAAGLQGNFETMHKAILEFPVGEEIPQSFVEETATLYGINYTQLQKDSDSKKIKKIIKDNQDAFSVAGLSSTPSFMMNDKVLIISEKNLPTLETLLNFITTAEK